MTLSVLLSFQGVDLSNIVKEVIRDNISVASRSKLILSLDNVDKIMKTCSGRSEDIIKELQAIREECIKSIAHRVLAGSLGAYNRLVEILKMYESTDEIVIEALSAITALMCGNPDLLDKQGIEIIIRFLDNQKNVEIQKIVLEWATVCCIKHEQNRQDIFEMKILTRLKSLLCGCGSPIIVRKVCAVIRALVLDDDIRVHYGNAHEHARGLATEILDTLADLLKSKLIS
jgi:hypothetical protein